MSILSEIARVLVVNKVSDSMVWASQRTEWKYLRNGRCRVQNLAVDILRVVESTSVTVEVARGVCTM